MKNYKVSDYNGAGCVKCPAKDRCCTSIYRGSTCSALRYECGADFDPATNGDIIRRMSDDELGVYLNRVRAGAYDEQSDSEESWKRWVGEYACKAGKE